MKIYLACVLLLSASFSTTPAVGAQTSPREMADAKANILPALQAMQVAANAHDAAKHLAFYVHDSTLLFVMNDQPIAGFNALLAQQREWWQNGKSNAVYEIVGEPYFRVPAPGIAIVTYFLSAHRTLADGTSRGSRMAVSSVWQKRAQGWKIIYAHESSVNQSQ
jgi:ketosteroid isomerase-like protein